MSAAHDGDEDDQAENSGDSADYEPGLHGHIQGGPASRILICTPGAAPHIEHEEGEHSEGDGELK